MKRFGFAPFLHILRVQSDLHQSQGITRLITHNRPRKWDELDYLCHCLLIVSAVLPASSLFGRQLRTRGAATMEVLAALADVLKVAVPGAKRERREADRAGGRRGLLHKRKEESSVDFSHCARVGRVQTQIGVDHLAKLIEVSLRQRNDQSTATATASCG